MKGVWKRLEGVFGRIWNMDVVSCLPGALVGGSLIPHQLLSTLIEVISRMVVIPSAYNEYWGGRLRRANGKNN